MESNKDTEIELEIIISEEDSELITRLKETFTTQKLLK